VECHIGVCVFEQLGEAGVHHRAITSTCETLEVHGTHGITVATHRKEARDG